MRTYLHSLKILALGISPTFLMLSGLPAIEPAQSQSFPEMVARLSFPKGSDRGGPRRTSGGGKRGPACGEPSAIEEVSEGELPLTAIMPENNLGTTTKGNPNIYIYVPPNNKKNAEFVIFDLTNIEETYEDKFALPPEGGIIKLVLPEKAQLQVGNEYQWHFGIICNAEDETQHEVVQGLLEKNTPINLEKIQEEKNLLEKADLYAQAEVWNETLDIAAKLRDSDPNPWLELLTSVGLENFIEQPIVEIQLD